MKLEEIKARMHSGKLYYCNDEALVAEQLQCLEHQYAFNQTRPLEQKKRQVLLRQIFAEVGDNCYVEPPLRANWGKHVHFGNNVYANFNLVLVDDTDIFVGDSVMFGPNVTVDTATHPIQPELRKKQAQYNLPVIIEENVWIGANTVILPGVRIGKNSVIGAGSIVTKDIPENVVAFGSPCRVVRPIGEEDAKFYHKDQPIDIV